MKNIKSILLSGAALLTAGILGTSCADKLDLGPIDKYGSESYWKNEAHVVSYVHGLHKALRDVTHQHTITFGELRGGTYKDGVSCDGMALSDGSIRLQNFDNANTGVSNFGDIYGKITNCNLLISRAPQVEMDAAKKDYCMAIAYGLRAFYYFELHRLYGGVPLRTGVEVIDGVLDPIKLYVGQSKPSEIMAHIKSDIDESLRLFGNQNGFNPYGFGSKCYWSKAATEALAADVYLWDAKTTCYDRKANPESLAKAKTYLNNVLNNYGLALEGNFADVFDAKSNKGNKEIIFAVRFLEGEAENNNGHYLYAMSNGFTQDMSLREDGSPWNNPADLNKNYTMKWEYKQELFNLYDEEDTRKDATFMGSYRYDENEQLVLYGVHTVKNIGYLNNQKTRIFCGDYIFYRLPWVYLSLAEIANMEGDKAGVETNINIVRQRAYGENWDKDVHGYVAGDFTQNELAILNERTKEFVQEGHRWWDMLRMTYTKGGDAMVFRKEATLEGQNPLLNKETEAHKILWPINVGVLNNDTTIRQIPGYGGGTQKECNW